MAQLLRYSIAVAMLLLTSKAVMAFEYNKGSKTTLDVEEVRPDDVVFGSVITNHRVTLRLHHIMPDQSIQLVAALDTNTSKLFHFKAPRPENDTLTRCLFTISLDDAPTVPIVTAAFTTSRAVRGYNMGMFLLDNSLLEVDHILDDFGASYFESVKISLKGLHTHHLLHSQSHTQTQHTQLEADLRNFTLFVVMLATLATALAGVHMFFNYIWAPVKADFMDCLLEDESKSKKRLLLTYAPPIVTPVKRARNKVAVARAIALVDK